MLYLIKRGPKGDHHKAPYHPVIICTKRKQAMWQAGSTTDKAWVWVKDDLNKSGGWLLCRWEGLDIDYGHVVHGITLPDGNQAAFWRNYPVDNGSCVTDIIKDAAWWSTSKIPEWLAEQGVKFPEDDFTKERIYEWREEEYSYLEPLKRLFKKS